MSTHHISQLDLERYQDVPKLFQCLAINGFINMDLCVNCISTGDLPEKEDVAAFSNYTPQAGDDQPPGGGPPAEAPAATPPPAPAAAAGLYIAVGVGYFLNFIHLDFLGIADVLVDLDLFIHYQ